MSRVSFLGVMYLIVAIIFGYACITYSSIKADVREMDSQLEEDRIRIKTVREKYYPQEIIDTADPKDYVKTSSITSVETAPVVEPEPLVRVEESELDLMARVIHAEAGNQSMEGKRLVAAVILNRSEDSRFPDSIEGVLTAPGQFSTVKSGAIYKYTPDITDYGAAVAELLCRSNDRVLYFSSEGYQRTPVVKEGGHYFSE